MKGCPNIRLSIDQWQREQCCYLQSLQTLIWHCVKDSRVIVEGNDTFFVKRGFCLCHYETRLPFFEGQIFNVHCENTVQPAWNRCCPMIWSCDRHLPRWPLRLGTIFTANQLTCNYLMKYSVTFSIFHCIILVSISLLKFILDSSNGLEIVTDQSWFL